MHDPRQGHADAEHPPSWYRASALGLVDHPVLDGPVETDVCVIGAGYTGLSAALHLAQRGYSVTVLEARRVGWGASGRNGGQIGTGQRRDEDMLEAQFGRDAAHDLFQLAEEAKALVRDLVSRHAIDCDLREGQILCAAKPAHAHDLAARAARLASDYGYPQQQPLSREELRTLVASPAFFGGVFDAGAAHLHPLNYVLGLARAGVASGVRIFERSPATGYTGTAPVQVRTPQGSVRATTVVLACNGYLGRLEPRIADRIMPINNFVLATEPLGARAAQLITNGACAHDTLFVVNYFRLSADQRLIFGGGENYTPRFPADLKALVRRHMLRVFPQLEDVRIDHAWGGTLAITMNRLPHVGRLDGDLWFAHGYSGHGVATATLAGQLLAEAIAGTSERFDLLARRPPPRFPGGTWLRRPGMTLGMLWYALRDRL
jgi:gamma-glutamylputrescine oxidase